MTAKITYKDLTTDYIELIDTITMGLHTSIYKENHSQLEINCRDKDVIFESDKIRNISKIEFFLN